jgi:hypothetical protein
MRRTLCLLALASSRASHVNIWYTKILSSLCQWVSRNSNSSCFHCYHSTPPSCTLISQSTICLSPPSLYPLIPSFVSLVSSIMISYSLPSAPFIVTRAWSSYCLKKASVLPLPWHDRSVDGGWYLSDCPAPITDATDGNVGRGMDGSRCVQKTRDSVDGGDLLATVMLVRWCERGNSVVRVLWRSVLLEL